MGARQTHGLQIDEDLRFQRRDWLAQRVGWCALGLILLAGFAGAFGSGPLSHLRTTNGRGLAVEYERFVRHGARTNVTVRVAPAAISSDQARISLSRDYLLSHDLLSVVPEPRSVRSVGNDIEYLFAAASGQKLEVRWTIEPDALGAHAASVRFNSGPPAAIVQFTYP
jgi:hypothetical protein